MAAYGALVSLMHIIHQIENHPSPPISLQKQQVQSLTEIVTFLQEFLEGYVSPFRYSDEADPLEMRIADAVYAAEDVIESYIVDNIHLAAASTTEDDDVYGDNGDNDDGGEVMDSNIVDNVYLAAVTTHDGDGGDDDDDDMMDSIQLAAAEAHDEDEQIRYYSFYEGLQKVIEAMDLIKKEAMEMDTEKAGVEADLPRNVSVDAGLVSSSIERKSEMMGFDDVLLQLFDRLIGINLNRQIIPITGMGGICKTTLARNAFESKLIKESFDVFLWATISQDYNIEQTLREVVYQARGGLSNNSKGLNELGEELHKYLYCRRYLVVMDDLWSIDAWDKMKFFFPDNNNGSRIIVTTRLSNLAVHLTDSNSLLYMRFLDEVSSWDLFSKTVFGEECFPFELEGIGKKIVKNCKGLPLALVVIGGLMAKSQRTQEYWEHIEKNLSSIVNSENDGYCLKILMLSYNHLPAYLKPCFLYMAVFEEDRRIVVSTLIKLWVSEGFLKPKNRKNLEIVAKEYLKELVERNLIVVDKLGSLGKIKFCKVHDLLRDLSLNEAQKQRFCYVFKENSPRDMKSQRRIVIPRTTPEEEVVGASESMSHARSCICYQRLEQLPNFRLLRTLHTIDDNFGRGDTSFCYALEDVFRLVNLRYLSVCTNVTSQVPSSISLPWNLHTLVIQSKNEVMAPKEFWRMHQLKHVVFKIGGGLRLPDPPSSESDNDVVILENMQNLKGVISFNMNEEVARRIPNIKKLKISYEGELIERVNCLSYLHCLSKLERLECFTEDDGRDEYLKEISFPPSLKKLRIEASDGVEPEHLLTKIGSLPFLHTLWFGGGFFRTRKWEIVEGQFMSLKSLTLSRDPYLQSSKHGNLEKWTMPDSNSCFPLLERLCLYEFERLEEIPSEVGEIPMLKSIELIHCSESAVLSAKRIVEEQEDLYGEELALHVEVECDSDEQAEALQYLATPNFHVSAF